MMDDKINGFNLLCSCYCYYLLSCTLNLPDMQANSYQLTCANRQRPDGKKIIPRVEP